MRLLGAGSANIILILFLCECDVFVVERVVEVVLVLRGELSFNRFLLWTGSSGDRVRKDISAGEFVGDVEAIDGETGVDHDVALLVGDRETVEGPLVRVLGSLFLCGIGDSN